MVVVVNVVVVIAVSVVVMLKWEVVMMVMMEIRNRRGEGSYISCPAPAKNSQCSAIQGDAVNAGLGQADLT